MCYDSHTGHEKEVLNVESKRLHGIVGKGVSANLVTLAVVGIAALALAGLTKDVLSEIMANGYSFVLDKGKVVFSKQ